MYKHVIVSKGVVPNQVFTEELKQNLCNEESNDKISFKLFENEEFCLACSDDNTVFFADTKGNIRIYELDFQKQKSRLKVEKNIDFEINESCKVGYVNNKYFIANLLIHRCAFVDEEGNFKILPNQVKAFCINDDVLSIANMNGTIEIGNRIISITHGSITLFCVSFKHDRLVFISDDGFLNVYSLRKFRFLSSYNIGLDANIKHILITDTFGIIVIISDKEISLFTVNGFFIKKETIPFSIVDCCTYKVANNHLSNELMKLNGVDRICCSSSNQVVCAFDVMFPSKWKEIITANGLVTSIKCNAQNKVVNMTSKNGVHYVLPLKLL